MKDEYNAAWAVPKDTNPEILVRTANWATKAMIKLIDDNYGKPASEADIQGILNYYGFGIGNWKIKYDPKNEAWKIHNAVWNLMKDRVVEI